MRADDARAFMARDWSAVAEAKDDAWLALRDADGVPGVMRVAGELWDHARLVKPDWPSDGERADDLASHARVAEMFRRAGRIGRG